MLSHLIVVVHHTSSGATDFHTQLSFVCYLPPGSLSSGRLDLYSAPLFHVDALLVLFMCLVKCPDLQFENDPLTSATSSEITSVDFCHTPIRHFGEIVVFLQQSKGVKSKNQTPTKEVKLQQQVRGRAED